MAFSDKSVQDTLLFLDKDFTLNKTLTVCLTLIVPGLV